MDLNVIEIHVKSYIASMQKVICKIFFDHIPLVPATNYEFVDSIVAVCLKDVPKNWLSADLNHWLGAQMRFFGQARSEAAGKNDGFHGVSAWLLAGL